MLIQSTGENVGSISGCHKIEVVNLGRVKRCQYGGLSRAAYWPRWKSWIFVSVIWRVHLQILKQQRPGRALSIGATQTRPAKTLLMIQSIYHCGIALQKHPQFQAIVIYRRDHLSFPAILSLLFNHGR